MRRGLKPKKVKGKITILRASQYKKIMIYLRKIGNDIFEYLIPYKGQIYSSYLIITPENGKRKLTKDQINQAAALIFTSATTTVDFLLGDNKIDKKTKEVVKVFEEARKQVDLSVN